MLLASASAMAQDEIFDDRWFVTVIGGTTNVDNDRNADEEWPYYGASIGKFFTPNVSLELQLDTYESEFDTSKVTLPAGASDKFENFSYGLFGRYHWRRGEDWRPFVMTGVGIQEHDSVFDDGRDVFVSAGVGATANFGDSWRLRAQFEARYDNDRETFNSNGGFFDGIFSLGLSYAFGEPPRPPAPAAEREPAIEPAPRPAPRPEPQPQPEPEREVIVELDSEVTFAFDSAEIRSGAESELNDVADELNGRTEIVSVEVAGHTDSIGTEEYNQDLSERRAQAVADYFASRGVDRDRMEVRGYGETRPKVSNDTPENRAMNRRVVVSILARRDD